MDNNSSANKVYFFLYCVESNLPFCCLIYVHNVDSVRLLNEKDLYRHTYIYIYIHRNEIRVGERTDNIKIFFTRPYIY